MFLANYTSKKELDVKLAKRIKHFTPDNPELGDTDIAWNVCHSPQVYAPGFPPAAHTLYYTSL